MLMKNYYSAFLCSLILHALAIPASAQEKIILLDEGNWQCDNGRITYFEGDHVISNQWFRDVNGRKLGDTPNDIIHVKPNLIAIAINWSNIIQFIDAEGRAVAATEDVPNNRCLASDGDYVYVTSYAHECQTTAGLKTFTKGYVAKIDLNSYKVIDAVEVGYEPEGIALYKGKLFVANSGGYAFQENHEYEKTVSVIDAASMAVERTIDTDHINLYGSMSQSGQYLCINSPGDYYTELPATVILDCQAALDGKSDAECCVALNYASTNNCVSTDGAFLAIGSRYSYLTGQYEFNYTTIDPEVVMRTGGIDGVSETLPGTVKEDIQSMSMPYGIYVNPYTGYIYATDAAGFAEGGTLYQWSPQGALLGKHSVYINPSHFLALNPDGESASMSGIISDDIDIPLYNLQGIPVYNPRPGEIYIKNGKKNIHK